MRSSTSLPFGAVSKELAMRLEAEAEGLVQHHVRAYEAHLYYQNRQELRDPRVWRRVQSSGKQGFSVYRRVRRRRDQSGGSAPKTGPAPPRLNGPAPVPQSSSNGSSTSSTSAVLSALPSAALPTQLLGIGFTIGTIEDMIFGSMANTTAAIKIQSLYVNDPIVDAAVLAVLVPPNGNDPLSSVTLKWVLKKPKMYGVTRHRDYVFVESIGIRRSVSGERIGYHLMHSVELPSFPPLSADDAVVRRRLSSCYLYRSIGSGLIECFLRSSTDPWRSTPESLVIYAAANRLLQCCPGFMRVAETNKLIFALQHEMRNAKDRPARRRPNVVPQLPQELPHVQARPPLSALRADLLLQVPDRVEDELCVQSAERGERAGEAPALLPELHDLGPGRESAPHRGHAAVLTRFLSRAVFVEDMRDSQRPEGYARRICIEQ